VDCFLLYLCTCGRGKLYSLKRIDLYSMQLVGIRMRVKPRRKGVLVTVGLQLVHRQNGRRTTRGGSHTLVPVQRLVARPSRYLQFLSEHVPRGTQFNVVRDSGASTSVANHMSDFVPGSYRPCSTPIPPLSLFVGRACTSALAMGGVAGSVRLRWTEQNNTGRRRLRKLPLDKDRRSSCCWSESEWQETDSKRAGWIQYRRLGSMHKRRACIR
jgi:hypothetical protein